MQIPAQSLQHSDRPQLPLLRAPAGEHEREVCAAADWHLLHSPTRLLLHPIRAKHLLHPGHVHTNVHRRRPTHQCPFPILA
jgi:hypothetical protein